MKLADAAQAFQEGAAAYARGEFDAAAAAFERGIAAGARTADAHFNLALAYQRANQPGRAALALERALRRDPTDEAARDALAELRARSPDASLVAGAEPFFARVGARVDPDGAALTLLVTWTIACALLILRRWLFGTSRSLALAMAALLGLAAAGSAVAAIAARTVQHAPLAVVIVPEAKVRTGAEEAANVAFPVHAGLKVRIEHERGEHVEISLPNGLRGFLPRASIERIAPR